MKSLRHWLVTLAATGTMLWMAAGGVKPPAPPPAPDVRPAPKPQPKRPLRPRPCPN